MKKAFQSMKNQMHLDDYWRRILAEVWVMKHSGEDLGDGLVTHSSQPCLGEMGEDNLGMRKTVSMGDLIAVSYTHLTLPTIYSV